MGVTFNPATMVDVRSFGAVGNGQTDDAAAIAKAEAYADSRGMALYFGAGRYLLGSTLNLHSGDTLLGAAGATLVASGTNATAITAAPAGNPVRHAPLHDILVNGLTIEGNQALASPGSADPLVSVTCASGMEFKNVTFEHTPRIGVLLSNVDHTGFDGCTFSDIGYTEATGGSASCDTFAQGIAFTDSNIKPSIGNYVTGCTFSAIGLDAVSATQQTDMTIVGNTMSNLDVMSPAYWASRGEGSAGVYLDDNHGVTIASNRISGGSGAGIDTVNTQSLEIRDNTISGFGGSGIIVGNDQNVDIIRDTITNNNRFDNHFFFQAGISIADNMWGSHTGSSRNISVSRCTITDTQATKTQNWAIQANLEATPRNVRVNADNNFAGNAAPGGVGSSGIAQAWVEPWCGQVQAGPLTPGVQAWSPTMVSTAPFTASLLHPGSVGLGGVVHTQDARIGGVADPFLTVTLTQAGRTIATTTADAWGAWAVAPQLRDGVHAIVATESDGAGVVDTVGVTFVLDGAGPSQAVPPRLGLGHAPGSGVVSTGTLSRLLGEGASPMGFITRGGAPLPAGPAMMSAASVAGGAARPGLPGWRGALADFLQPGAQVPGATPAPVNATAMAGAPLAGGHLGGGDAGFGGWLTRAGWHVGPVGSGL